MAKTLEEVSKDPSQVYRTAEENQKGYRPRHEAQPGKTNNNAISDLNQLLGGKAKQTQQEHEVSVGIAKRMASDHVSSLDQEIKFMDSQLGPTESRDTAIARLKASIATTSGVSSGLGGDAAMAYDEMYIPTARKMASTAMSTWNKQQTVIDKNTLTTEFKTFMDNTYTSLDANDQQMFLAAWGERFSSFGDVSFNDIEEVGVKKITEGYMSQVKANPEGNHIQMANEAYAAYGTVESDGTITYKTNNVNSRKTMSDAVYTATQPRIKVLAAQKLKELNEAISLDNQVTTAKVTAYSNELNKYVERNGINMDTLGGEELDKYEAEKNRLEDKYSINSATTTTDDEIYNKVVGLESGGKDPYNAQNPKSSAFGKYQFTKARAQEMWNKAGIRGQMVHKQQTPAQQDRMWQAQLDSVKGTLESYGRELTPGNFYIVHQLGAEGSRRYFNGTMSQGDIENMNVNIGSKYAVPELHRAEIIQEWRLKHLKGELTEAQAVRTQSLVDMADGEVEHRKRKGQIRDAASDLADAKSLQSQLNTADKEGRVTDEQREKTNKNIDELMSNTDIATRERESFYNIQANTEGIIENTKAQKVELAQVNQAIAQTDQLLVDQPNLSYAEAYQMSLRAVRGEEMADKPFAFEATTLAAYNKVTENAAKQSLDELKDARKILLEDPLTMMENPKYASETGFAQLEKVYEKMSRNEKLRFMNAKNAYFGSQKYMVDMYSKGGYAGELPEAGEVDPVTGLKVSVKTRKELVEAVTGQFAGSIQRVFGNETATENEKSLMATALISGKNGVDSEVLNNFAKKIGEQMVTTPQGFASEYGKYPRLFAQPRFRTAVLANLKDEKERGTWFTYEMLSKAAVIEANQAAREEQEKQYNDPNMMGPSAQVKPDYSNIAETIAGSDAAINMQGATTGYLPTKTLEAMKEAGQPIANYVALVSSIGSLKVPPGEREVLYRAANKLVRSGNDHMIPMLSANMNANYIDVAEGIKGQPTRRIQQFFEKNPQTYQKPWFFVAEALSSRGEKISPVEAKELVDDGKISMMEVPGENRMVMVFDSDAGNRVTVPVRDDWTEDWLTNKPSGLPGFRR